MKILQVLQNYYPSIGGTQILFQKLGERCASAYNDEVQVFTTDSYYGPDKLVYKKIEPASEIINGVHVHRFSFARMHKKTFIFFQKALFKLFRKRSSRISRLLAGPYSPSLINAIKNTTADVIVGSSYGYSYVDYAVWRNKTGNPKPYVFQGAIHFQNDESIQVVNKRVLQSIHACEFYLANTEYEKQRIVKLGVEPGKIEVLGCTVNIEKFENGNTENYREKLGVASDEILVGYVGRIEPQKDIHLLIQALPLVWTKEKKVKLVIAGFKTGYTAELKKMALNVTKEEENSISFLSDLEEHEKISLYHALDIFVLPSSNESFGLVFLEAWACRKPVIGVNIGAVASVITNGADGLLMQPGDVQSLAAKIITLAKDRELRHTMGNNGYTKTKELYTLESVTKQYREILARAIEKFNKSQSR